MKRLSIAPTFALVLALVACTPDPLPGYRAATADERAGLFATVQEYYDIVDRAFVSGDMTPLYARHPKLAHGQVRERGINIEQSAAQLPSFRDQLVREVSVDIQSYEPLRAFVKDDHAVAYSHGLVTWTFKNGGLPSKGELLVRFDLTHDGDRWSIDQTDEWVLGEGTPPPTPR